MLDSFDKETLCKVGDEAVRYISDRRHWNKGAYIRWPSGDYDDDNVRSTFRHLDHHKIGIPTEGLDAIDNCQVCLIGDFIRAFAVHGLDYSDWQATGMVGILSGAICNTVPESAPISIHEFNDNPRTTHSQVVEIAKEVADKLCDR